MLTGFPCIPFSATGSNKVILIWTRPHQIDGLHIDSGALFGSLGCFLRWDTLSLLRIEEKLWNTERWKIHFYFLLPHFLGNHGFPWHPLIHTTDKGFISQNLENTNYVKEINQSALKYTKGYVIWNEKRNVLYSLNLKNNFDPTCRNRTYTNQKSTTWRQTIRRVASSIPWSKGSLQTIKFTL
jgi:hypothetical protein